MPLHMILYFLLPYFHVPNSAIYFLHSTAAVVTFYIYVVLILSILFLGKPWWRWIRSECISRLYHATVSYGIQHLDQVLTNKALSNERDVCVLFFYSCSLALMHPRLRICDTWQHPVSSGVYILIQTRANWQNYEHHEIFSKQPNKIC